MHFIKSQLLSKIYFWLIKLKYCTLILQDIAGEESTKYTTGVFGKLGRGIEFCHLSFIHDQDKIWISYRADPVRYH